jgi:hypothetical protein
MSPLFYLDTGSAVNVLEYTENRIDCISAGCHFFWMFLQMQALDKNTKKVAIYATFFHRYKIGSFI